MGCDTTWYTNGSGTEGTVIIHIE